MSYNKTVNQEKFKEKYADMTQEQRLEKYLKKHGRINPMQAWKLLGIYRLSAVIYNLRKTGFTIETTRKAVTNQFNEECHVAEYIFHQDGILL